MSPAMARYLGLEALMMRADAMGQTALADSLRTIMDPVWLQLTDEEHELLNRRRVDEVRP